VNGNVAEPSRPPREPRPPRETREPRGANYRTEPGVDAAAPAAEVNRVTAPEAQAESQQSPAAQDSSTLQVEPVAPEPVTAAYPLSEPALITPAPVQPAPEPVQSAPTAEPAATTAPDSSAASTAEPELQAAPTPVPAPTPTPTAVTTPAPELQAGRPAATEAPVISGGRAPNDPREVKRREQEQQSQQTGS
jgi:ribonuclease E